MRSRLVPVLFPLVLIGLIFSGMFAYGGLDDFMAQFKPAVEYGVEYADEYEAGKVFKGDIYAVLDSFASYETWKETENGARTEAKTTHEYFIIPAGEAEYVAIKVKADDLDAFYDISDATYAYLMDETAELESTPVYREAIIEEMDDELYGYFIEWFTDTEFLGTTNESEIEPYLLPYVISSNEHAGQLKNFYIGASVFLIIIIAVIIGMVLSAKRNKKYKAEIANIAQQAVANTEGSPAIPLQTDSTFGAQDTTNQQEFNYEDYYNNASK